MSASFAVDLREGLAPLTFDRLANPHGLPPEVAAFDGRPALRLAVKAGAYGAAVAGGPEISDRCEVREPDKLPIGATSVHLFSMFVPPAFPRVARRCVLAQMKGNDGRSPLFALRIQAGLLFVDWRLRGITVEHHDSIPSRVGRWSAVELRFGPDAACLSIDGDVVTRAHAPFSAMTPKRFLKLGPYRDRHPEWGVGEAAVLFRDISRIVL